MITRLWSRVVATTSMRLVVAFCLGIVATSAQAYSSYLDSFNAYYGTTGTRISSCGLCHFNFAGGGARTPYGEAYRNNAYSYSAIGALDSDGDGFTNDQEAAAAYLTMPGLACNNLTTVSNAPANLTDYVDPSNPGCVGSGQPPVANPNGPYSTINGQPVTLSSAGSYDPDGTITSYLWNFGAGMGTSTEPNPTVTYNIGFEARVTVTLTVSDNSGNSSTATTSVIVLNSPNAPPVANAGPPVSGVVNLPVQFNGTASKDPENSALTYNWNFGDGTSGTGAMPTHTYTRCGAFTVDLTVADNYGLTGKAATSANIAGNGTTYPIGDAGGGAAHQYNGSVGGNIIFDATASFDPDCSIVSYNWDFGDGATGTGLNPMHAYALAGDYVVTLTVTDNDGLQDIATAAVHVINVGAIDGATLYANNCAGCHGAGAASTKVGATVARINAGIANTATGMSGLSTLSAAEIQAISDYLISLAPPPPPPGTTPDGAQLYATNCSGCHGAGASSTKIGADVTRINNGISNVTSMNYLSTVLTSADVQAIADYLMSLAPPPPVTDGPTLYANYCASCHGAGAASTKVGATVARINAGISSVPSMNSLGTTLNATQIQAISDYLVSLVPTPPPGGLTGEQLYAANCAGCHGDGAVSTKKGATVDRINTGIATVATMNYLGTLLTAADVQAISDYLISLGPGTPTAPPTVAHTDNQGGQLHAPGKNSPYTNGCASCHGARLQGATGPSCYSCHNQKWSQSPPSTNDGPTLYGIYCAGCHYDANNSTKKGADLTRINSGITSVSVMSSLSVLTTTQKQAIADYLVSLGGGTGGGGGGTDGASLYATYCQSCHGVGSASTKVGADLTRINNGIANVASMNSLASLTTAQRQAIADYLISLGSTGGGGGGSGSTDGATLYTNSCAGCHGPGPSSTKAGRTAAQITASITSVPSMNFLSGSLTATQIQAIADYLATVTGGGGGAPTGSFTVAHTDNQGGHRHAPGKSQPYTNGCSSCHGARLRGGYGPSCYSCHSQEWSQSPPTTTNGTTLYGMYCAGCHGAGSESNKIGASVARINAGISSESLMSSLSVLSSTQIQAISNYLVSLGGSTGGGGTGGGTGGTTDGATLYTNNCSGCHGSGSGISNKTASGISSAISSVGAMSGLTGLTSTQINAIATYLQGLGGGTGGGGTGTTDGATLYANYCASCHGSGSNTTKGGATVSRITNAISSVSSMNSLSSLSSAQIQAIATYLGTISAPTTGQGMYAAYCASCHGADARGGTSGANVRGASNSSIRNAISTERDMQSLSFLTYSQTQAIATYLQSLSSTSTRTRYRD